MKAVLLAGGRGERLAPLTDTCPKPLVRVLDTPVIEYALAALKALGIRSVAVTTCYRAEDFVRVLGEVVHGVYVHYVQESAPLGTAGAVKACEDFLDEEFLVLSADALFDFDLGEAIAFHREKKALATLVLTERDDVGEYGLVKTDASGRILGFSEKPTWQGVFTNCVNCGIYVCQPELLAYVPSGRPFDFSCDLFPRLLQEERGLYGIALQGNWCDIGSPEALYECNFAALSGRLRLPISPRGRILGSGAQQSFVGEGVVLLPGSCIERSILGGASRIARAHVRDSVIGRGAHVEEGAYIAEVLAGDRLRCEKNVILSPATVLGNDVTLRAGARSAENERLAAGTIVHAEKAGFQKPKERFDSAAFSVQGGADTQCREIYLFGRALSACVPQLMVCCREDSRLARAASDAVCAGICSTGRLVLRAAVGTRGEARFAAAHLCIPTLFVSASDSASRSELQLYDENGLLPASACIRAVEKALCHSRAEEAAQVGEQTCLTELLDSAYLAYLVRLLPPLEGVSLSLCRRAGVERLFRALSLRGAQIDWNRRENGIFLNVDERTFSLDFFCDGKPLADARHLRAALLLSEAARRKTLFALEALPMEVEARLKAHGVRIFYPENTLGHTADALVKKGALGDFYLYDYAALAAASLAYWQRESPEFCPDVLTERLLGVPFATRERAYCFEGQNSAKLFSRLWDRAEKSEGGLLIRHKGGVSHLYPSLGRVKILSEAQNAELAEELCDFTEEELNTVLRQCLEEN